jgi:Putative transposase, YhgA-like
MGKQRVAPKRTRKKPPSKPILPAPVNDHDALVRGLWSIGDFVHKQLHYGLPERVRKYMDFKGLRPLPDTHVNPKLRTSASDGIYECPLLVSALPEPYRSMPQLPKLRFCILMEAKSSIPSEPLDFQMESYRKALWRRDLANDEFPSIIIGILIYNGERAWKTKTIYAAFEPYLPSDLLGLIPKTEYFTIDLFQTTDPELENSIELGELRTAYLALKHGHDPEFLKANAKFLFKFALDLKPKNLLHLFLRWVSEYIQRRTKLSEPEFVHLLTDDSEMSTQFKTVFELIEERTAARFAGDLKKAATELKKEKALAKQAKIEAVKAKDAEVKAKEELAKAEAKTKETEVKAKETEAKAKETEAKAKETEAKAKETEAKAAAEVKVIIKTLMRTLHLTDEQLVTQFAFSAALVASVRAELNAL